MTLKPGEVEIASDTMGVFGSNRYDLYLVKLKTGDYKLIIFMKVQFFFEDGPKLKWNLVEKALFVARWQAAIQRKWGNRVIKNLSKGKKVRLEFRFETQIGGVMWDHWEITVNKIPKGSFETSFVRWSDRYVDLDSEDLTLTPKGHGQKQRGVVHEFGHMLGLKDEYLKKSPHKTDYKSIMNRGETVLHRHSTPFMKWLNKQLKSHGIK